MAIVNQKYNIFLVLFWYPNSNFVRGLFTCWVRTSVTKLFIFLSDFLKIFLSTIVRPQGVENGRKRSILNNNLSLGRY